MAEVETPQRLSMLPTSWSAAAMIGSAAFLKLARGRRTDNALLKPTGLSNEAKGAPLVAAGAS